MPNIPDKTLHGNISKKLQLQAVENCCQTEISNSKQTPVRSPQSLVATTPGDSHWLDPAQPLG